MSIQCLLGVPTLVLILTLPFAGGQVASADGRKVLPPPAEQPIFACRDDYAGIRVFHGDKKQDGLLEVEFTGDGYAGLKDSRAAYRLWRNFSFLVLDLERYRDWRLVLEMVEHKRSYVRYELFEEVIGGRRTSRGHCSIDVEDLNQLL